mgnify:CR=1 FL=1
MTHLSVLIIATLVWVIWIPATIFEKRARGDKGSVSIIPVIPLFPLFAWVCAYGFDRFNMPLGANIIALFHMLLFIAMLISIAKSVVVMRRSNKE